MKLISNWRKAWRMASVQVSVAIVAWVALPPEAQAAAVSLLGIAHDKVPGLLALLGIVARIVSQPAVHAADREVQP